MLTAGFSLGILAAFFRAIPASSCRTCLDREGSRRQIGRLLGLCTVPEFAIGQRALFLRTPSFNVLWDCISLIDVATVEIIKALGGIHAIAISHPHYYSSMVE